MLPARKNEGSHVEDGVKRDDGPIERRIEVRLLRLEDKVTVIATDVTELKGEVKSLRTRIEDGFQSLRKEMTDSSQSLRKEIGDAKIWALIIAAGVLGILAKGFHWI
jgi:hypothetical protein